MPMEVESHQTMSMENTKSKTNACNIERLCLSEQSGAERIMSNTNREQMAAALGATWRLDRMHECPLTLKQEPPRMAEVFWGVRVGA